MSLPPLTYLSMDELARGVGASQVVPYVERLARLGVDVTVHSFEHGEPDPAVSMRLAGAGVRWRPHPFGRTGSAGGLGRVLRLAAVLRAGRRPALVHARSDLAAAAAMLGGAERWVWDVRSFWVDQRIELGMVRPGGPEERLLRAIERQAARRSDAVVTLAAAALPVLQERHGDRAVARSAVVPTCVDLDAFRPVPVPEGELRFLLSGSLNRYYDVPTTLRLVGRARARRPATLEVLSPATTPWDDELRRFGATRQRADPGDVPAFVARSHVGLSICASDAGSSLRAAMPTKLAEFLAVGRPVVVNEGLGDMDALLSQHACGVVLHGTTDDAVEQALDELDALLADPELAERCQRLARAHFDVDLGVVKLLELYEAIVA